MGESDFLGRNKNDDPFFYIASFFTKKNNKIFMAK